MNVTEIEFGNVDWIILAYDNVQWLAVVNTLMYLRVALKSMNFFHSWATIGLSKRTVLHDIGYFAGALLLATYNLLPK
jgi:hypothetical protein